MSMKFLIVSDTHGRMYNLEEAMEREEFDGGELWKAAYHRRCSSGILYPLAISGAQAHTSCLQLSASL